MQDTMPNQYDDLRSLVARHSDDLTTFCQRLVQTPSPPGEEDRAARLISSQMKGLGYDDVWFDRWGNVIGHVRGTGHGKPVLFNGHMDHVDPGNPADWPYPPFGGEIHDGLLWGRGAADMKGPLAAMIYAVGALAWEGIRPPGDVFVTAVVQEEVGGLGTHKLEPPVPPGCAVVGEATANHLARGHRGRVEVVVRLKGRSVHASNPAAGVNPHAVLARFIIRLEALKLAQDDTFGGSTVAPTLLTSDQQASNVVPGQLSLHLDWRNLPGETMDDVVRQLRPLLDASLAEVEGSQGEIVVRGRDLRTWTGEQVSMPAAFPSFCLEADHPMVVRGQQILSRALSRVVDVTVWSFATDGGHLMEADIPVIGFGPGEEHTVHTVREYVPVSMLVESMLGYMALALELGTADKPGKAGQPKVPRT
jgi:putative selenium metabolism hydrolase